MPDKQLDITNKTFKNVDSLELTGFIQDKFDIFLNSLKHFQRRPGLSTFDTISSKTGIIGLYFWEEKDRVIIVTRDGCIYSTTEFGVTTNITGVKLEEDNQVSFALDNSSNILIMANGGKMVYTSSLAVTAYIADTDAPTDVTHVAFLDSYIFALSTSNTTTTDRLHSGIIYFSEVGDYTDWGTLNFLSAEALPDKAVAILVFNQEITIFGKESLEVYWNDGSSPFSRINSGFTAAGCSAPYSVVEAGNTLFWLNENREYVKRNGRTPVPVSIALNKELQSLSTVSDCIAQHIRVDGHYHIYITFPTEKKTYVYDYMQDDWWQASYWDQTNALREHWRGNSYVWAKTWGKHLVGDRDNGKIYEMSGTYTDDADDLMNSEIITGHIDYGTVSKRKISDKLSIKIKSGNGGKMMFKTRDDNGLWGEEKEIDLLGTGNNKPIKNIFRLGVYYTRQYSFKITDSVEFILMGIIEMVRKLAS